MDFLEKIATLVFQATGSLSSWSTIFTNIISVLFTFSCRDFIRSLYATLDPMNVFVAHLILILIALSLYGLIFRAVSFTFSLAKRFSAQKRSKLLKIQRSEIIKQKLFLLSQKEIALLNFLLAQDSHTAWLPRDSSVVALLREKGIIKPFGRNIKTIYDHQKTFQEAMSYAIFFTIPENVKNIIFNMPPELAAKWRNTRTNNSFAQFQK